MLPIDKKWYRNLLIFAVALGVVGAFSALAYNTVTDTGIDIIFGDAGTDWWSGKWWWIPLTAFGGLLVAIIRSGWRVEKDVPGGLEFIGKGWVNPKSAFELVAIAIVSALLGASLGPSFGLILLGGAVGSWLVGRLKFSKNHEAKDEYSLTGMAGILGGAFSAPIFSAALVSEVSSTKTKNYVQAFLPQLLAATVGFAIYYAITGSTLLGSFQLPKTEYEAIQLVYAVALGLVATVLLLLFVVITKAVNAAAAKIADPRLKGLIGGAIVGFLAFALPLSAGSGVSQLNEILAEPSSWGIAFLFILLIAKMLGISISLASGFLGGNVFPIMFIGGVAGVMINAIFPDIPLGLAVASMLAAVPGAFLKAPLSLTLIGAGTVGLAILGIAPVALALVISHTAMSFIRESVVQKKTSAQA